MILDEVEELAGTEQLVPTHRVQSIEVADEVSWVGRVAFDQVVVRGYHKADIERLGELRGLAEVGVPDDALSVLK